MTKGVCCIFFIMYKNEWENLISKINREVILNRAKYYYENDKKRLREQAGDKYRSLSEEEKNKKREYGRKRYHIMSEEKKQNLKEYQKKYREAKKTWPFVLCLLIMTIESLIFMYSKPTKIKA